MIQTLGKFLYKATEFFANKKLWNLKDLWIFLRFPSVALVLLMCWCVATFINYLAKSVNAFGKCKWARHCAGY